MKIGITKYQEGVYKKKIKYRYKIEADNPVPRSTPRTIATILSNKNHRINSTIKRITDIKTHGTYKNARILEKFEFYQEVDLDKTIDFDRLNQSLMCMPLCAETLIDMIKVLQELHGKKKIKLRKKKLNKYRFITNR